MTANGASDNGTKDNRLRALEVAIEKIEKDHGRGSIMRLGEVSAAMAVETIPTGSLSLDIALGAGGIPRGRITEIFGPEMAGKSTLAMHIIAEAQKLDGLAAYIDVEHAMDPTFAQVIGINIDDLLISQPDTGEQALEICEALVGLQARLMSQALRKLAAAISRSRMSVIFINQLREKIGIVFGNPETTPGGRALKFYSSVRIDLRRIETLKRSGTVIGNRVRAKIVKNKIAPPFRLAEFDIIFSGPKIGISREGDILDLGTEAEIIKKPGAFYSYKDNKMGQGRENAKDFLRTNPEIASEIEDLIRAQGQLEPTTAGAKK
ncbi:MAG: DNA recombination/repair protein RecA [Deltaproteobacteria bacterium]|nr:DNA recombination/repair protein RecA [Deltaproteobacteria bacterium]